MENVEQQTPSTAIEEVKPAETQVEQPKPTEETAPKQEVPNAVEAPAYKPNFKFKVADFENKTKKELEFDEFLRGAIKEEAHEKRVRELYEKAHGIDEIKQARAKLQEEHHSLKNEHHQLRTTVQEIVDLRDKDFDGFLEAVGVKPETVYAWVQKKLNYQNLPPEQRAEYDEYQRTRRQAMVQERTFAQQQAAYQQQVQQLWDMQVDNSLSRPEVRELAEAFDERAGKPGAFKALVYERGYIHQQRTGKDLSVEEAINEARNLVGLQRPVAAQPVQAGTPPVQKPATIPNLGTGKGSSPVTKKITKFEDLEAEVSAHFARK